MMNTSNTIQTIDFRSLTGSHLEAILRDAATLSSLGATQGDLQTLRHNLILVQSFVVQSFRTSLKHDISVSGESIPMGVKYEWLDKRFPSIGTQRLEVLQMLLMRMQYESGLERDGEFQRHLNLVCNRFRKKMWPGRIWQNFLFRILRTL